MRVLFDPVTAIISGIAGIASIGSGIMGANQAVDRGTYERDYYNWQANQEALAYQRDADAATKERQTTLSRTRALMAGQGGGMDTDYLGRLESEFAINERTLIEDSNSRQDALRTKGRMAAKQADQEAQSSMIKGITGSIKPFGSLYTALGTK